MKLYGRYGETDTLDAFMWRIARRPTWGLLVPVTWRRLLLVRVSGHRLEAWLAWRRPADLDKAWSKRLERLGSKS